jgi:hypothetical protein
MVAIDVAMIVATPWFALPLSCVTREKSLLNTSVQEKPPIRKT